MIAQLKKALELNEGDFSAFWAQTLAVDFLPLYSTLLEKLSCWQIVFLIARLERLEASFSSSSFSSSSDSSLEWLQPNLKICARLIWLRLSYTSILSRSAEWWSVPAVGPRTNYLSWWAAAAAFDAVDAYADGFCWRAMVPSFSPLKPTIWEGVGLVDCRHNRLPPMGSYAATNPANWNIDGSSLGFLLHPATKRTNWCKLKSVLKSYPFSAKTCLQVALFSGRFFTTWFLL